MIDRGVLGSSVPEAGAGLGSVLAVAGAAAGVGVLRPLLAGDGVGEGEAGGWFPWPSEACDSLAGLSSPVDLMRECDEVDDLERPDPNTFRS